MYLSVANEAAVRARAAFDHVARIQQEADQLRAQIDAIDSKYGGDLAAAAEESEQLCIYLVDRVQHDLETAYGAFVSECSLVHISCSAAAEAIVNRSAAESLQGAGLEAFDKLSLEGKWLLLPKIMNKPALDPGRQPLQGLFKVIRYRNSLLHYKTKREPYEAGVVAPETRARLGLSVEAVEKALEATTDCLTKLKESFRDSSREGNPEEKGFFEFRIESKPL